MPSFVWSHHSIDEYEDTNSFFDGVGIRLKRKDSTGAWAPDADFASPSIITFCEFRADGLTELFGFLPRFNLNDGEIEFQLSPDSGVNYYRFDGVNWVNDGQFSTFEEIDEGLPSFPLGLEIKTIKPRVRLTASSDLTKSPYLKYFTLYYEIKFSFIEDVMRSIKADLEENLEYCEKQIINLDCGSSTLELQLTTNKDNPGILKEPITVYNLDDDPTRQNNLFSSLGPNNLITLTSPQVGTLEVEYIFIPPVFITTDEYYFTSTTPSVVIIAEAHNQSLNFQEHNSVYEYSYTNKLARARESPRLEYLRVILVLQDYRKIRVLSLCDSIDRLYERGYTIPSLKTGMNFLIPNPGLGVEKDTLDENLKSTEYTFLVSANRWVENKKINYREIPLSEQVILKIINGGNYETFTIT